eukprot:gene5994-4299_t
MPRPKCDDSLSDNDELNHLEETPGSSHHRHDSVDSDLESDPVSYKSGSSFEEHYTSAERHKNLPTVSGNNSASRTRQTKSSSSHRQDEATYNRPYSLTSTKHKQHPESLQRSGSGSGSRQRSWNSKKKKEETPKESLPSIEVKKKTKYSYLAEGKSTSGGKKKDYYHLENEEDDDELRWLREASNHMSERTYLREIRKKLNEIDFEEASHSCKEEGPQSEVCKPARSLFKIFSKNKELITPEDLHELLLLFTTPGVALREATDFMWEECDQKNALNFQDFLRYGDTLRLRLLDFETFRDLTDEQKLLVTSARVFPGVPTTDPEKARVRLMMANRQQADGNISPEVRPLRIYEHLFLDHYQRKLYRNGLLANEEAAGMQQGDLSSDLPPKKNNYNRDSDEDISWGDGHGDKAAGSDDDPEQEHREPSAEHRDSDYPALASCNRSNPKAQRRVKRSKAKGNKGVQKPQPLGTRPGNIPFAQRQKPPFNLDFQSRPSSDKYIGRILEDEYEDRRAADDYLLRRIQENFMRIPRCLIYVRNGAEYSIAAFYCLWVSMNPFTATVMGFLIRYALHEYGVMLIPLQLSELRNIYYYFLLPYCLSFFFFFECDDFFIVNIS